MNDIVQQEASYKKKGLIVFRQLSMEDRCPEKEKTYHQQGYYISARAFGTGLCTAIQCGDLRCYLHRYITPALLIVDGAEYLAGKDSTQNELYAILKQRVDATKTTIIISKLSLECLRDAIQDDLLHFLTIEEAPFI